MSICALNGQHRVESAEPFAPHCRIAQLWQAHMNALREQIDEVHSKILEVKQRKQGGQSKV